MDHLAEPNYLGGTKVPKGYGNMREEIHKRMGYLTVCRLRVFFLKPDHLSPYHSRPVSLRGPSPKTTQSFTTEVVGYVGNPGDSSCLVTPFTHWLIVAHD